MYTNIGFETRWHHILKGKMLEGKCNQHLNHLLYILMHKVIPFYKVKHQSQQYGFQGPNLEMQQCQKMQAQVATFTLDDIVEVAPGHLYLVHSQSHPEHQHTVDMEIYTCDCKSFLLIYCYTHLCTVQHLFLEIMDEVSLTLLWICMPKPCKEDKMNTDEIQPSYDSTVTDSAGIVSKIQQAAVHTHIAPPTHLTDNLRQLNSLLDTILTSSLQPTVLPKVKMIAPNQHSWLETKLVMGVQIKTKHKSQHTSIQQWGAIWKEGKGGCWACFDEANSQVHYKCYWYDAKLTFDQWLALVIISLQYCLSLSISNTSSNKNTGSPLSPCINL